MDDDVPTQWLYFSDRDQALIRVPVRNGVEGPGERYWGRKNWFPSGPYGVDWADQIKDTLRYRYRQINESEVPAIRKKIDQQEGGVFRDRGRFWRDQADDWSPQSVASRIAELESLDMMLLSFSEIQENKAEVARLRAYLDQGPNDPMN